MEKKLNTLTTNKKIIINKLQSGLVVACLTLSVGIMPASAQTRSGNTNQQQANAANAKVTLNLQDVDIRVLINTVAEVSGKNFIVDPRVKGKVSVISGASLDPDQLYDVFLSILEVHNFATVDSGNVIKVLPSNVIKQRPTPTLFTPTEETNDAQITQIITLNHAAVQDLVPIIRPLIPATSHFAPHVPSNSVVLTDTAANIQRVLKIIRRIDVPDKRANTHVVPLNKTKATDLATTLTQLTGGGANAATGAASKVSIQALDSINSLIITAPDDEYIKIQALIDELDIEREIQSDVNVIYLKHAKAPDLVSILNDVTASSAQGASSDFNVQADEATNSLIVKASGSQLKAVQGVVDLLDLRRAQVFVETVIAEVSLNQQANLGIEWSAGGPRTVGTAAPTTGDGTDGGGTATTGGGTIGNLVDRDFPNTVVGTASLGFDGDGTNFSLLNFGRFDLTVIINALRSDTNSNILSTPTILTLDNEEAEIVVGQEVPFVTGQFNNGLNNSTQTDSDGNAVSTNVGSNFQTIERRDVGITLRITPQISDGDTIQLDVFQEISSVSNTSVAGQADLITNRNSIEAVVQVDDGQVVVLGGLIQDNVNDVEVRVPLLGRIPIIGNLFRSTEKAANKSNLMIFLKPRIIRSADELAKYSKEKYKEIQLEGNLSRNNILKNDLLNKGAEPPVLDDYDEVVDGGSLVSKRRREYLEENPDGVPEKKEYLINRILPKKKKFESGGVLDDDLDARVEEELKNKDNRVEWKSENQ